MSAIREHQQYLEHTGEKENRDRERLHAELNILIQSNLVQHWREKVSADQYSEILDSLFAREISPHQAAALLVNGGHPA
jgi:putative protein kinase ArgK-like GTPase of G3E family